MVMHSRLLPEVVPFIAPADALAGHQVWVSHGTDDGVIPLANAHDIRHQLSTWPIAVEYAEFPGGHEIRPAELTAAMAWLAGLRPADR
jgi:phospholipase/carboxylesterase